MTRAELVEKIARGLCRSVWGDEVHWTGCRPQATAALAAIEAAGCVVVPREATTKMEFAGSEAGYENVYEPGETVDMRAAWRAMLSASPLAQEPGA